MLTQYGEPEKRPRLLAPRGALNRLPPALGPRLCVFFTTIWSGLVSVSAPLVGVSVVSTY